MSEKTYRHHRFEGPCFGRQRDLDFLKERATRAGMTALFGRAQSGKSRLFGRLEENGLKNGKVKSSPLWGYAEGSRQADVLLRAIVDVYRRCLSNASFFDQAKVIWHQLGPRWVNKLADTGSWLTELFKAGDPSGVTTKVLQNTFSTLKQANEALTKGGVALKALPFEEAKDLLELVHLLSGHRPIILILDAFEQVGPAFDDQYLILRRFLEHYRAWPFVHIFLGVRVPDTFDTLEDNDIQRKLIEFEKAHDHCFSIHRLGDTESRLDLSTKTERQAVIDWVRHCAPDATSNLDDDELLALIDGHAGVLGRWHKGPPKDEAELKTQAENAIYGRYPELSGLLNTLLKDPSDQKASQLACEMVLLPELTSEDEWTILGEALAERPMFVKGELEQILIRMRNLGLLESCYPFPRFGHTTRYQCAQNWWFDADNSGIIDLARHFATSLIPLFAARITKLDSTVMPFIYALIVIGSQAQRLDLSLTDLTICKMALSILDEQTTISPQTFSDIMSGYPDAKMLTGIAIVKGLRHAEEEELAHQDELLGELRKLYGTYSEDEAVRELLAEGLHITVYYAKENGESTRGDGLLEELRSLCHTYPQDKAVRELLAKGLYFAVYYAKENGELTQGDELLEELRALCRTYPQDEAVRELLAMALNKTKEKEKWTRQVELLEELWTLCHTYPQDEAVRELLAKGLYSAVYFANEESDLTHRGDLLEGLRTLCRTYPQDEAVREQLAHGLVNTLIDLSGEEGVAPQEKLLEELRALCRTYPQDKAVREQLAHGLVNALINAITKGKERLTRQEELLEELRALYRSYLQDEAVRESLAKGLYNTLQNSKKADLTWREEWLDELQALSLKHPSDRNIGEFLAFGLAFALDGAIETKNQKQINDFELKVRLLSDSFPNDEKLQFYCDYILDKVS